MYEIYKAIHDRMYKFLRAENPLAEDALTGAASLTLEDATHFGFEGINTNTPGIMLMDDNTTGRRISDQYEGVEMIDVASVDTDTNIVLLETPLQNDWLTSTNAYARRAPDGMKVEQVVIGDLGVVKTFPTVCVVPTSESMDWFTMPGGTRETINIDFMIYVSEGDSETATEDLLRLTKAVKWILMSNLHIQVKDAQNMYEVSSVALVKSVDYGVIQKGSEFLKSAKLSWEGDIFVLRDYLHSTENAPYEGTYDSDHGLT